MRSWDRFCGWFGRLCSFERGGSPAPVWPSVLCTRCGHRVESHTNGLGACTQRFLISGGGDTIDTEYTCHCPGFVSSRPGQDTRRAA